MKKSVLKKWWFWVIIAIMVPFITISILYTDGIRPEPVRTTTTAAPGETTGETTGGEFQIGEAAMYQGMSLTVTKVEMSAGNDTVKPPDGSTFIHIYVKIENIDSPDVTVSPKSFSLMNTEDNEMLRYQFSSDVAIADADALPIEHLTTKGTSREGVIGFTINEGQTGLKLYYTDNYFNPDKPKLIIVIN